MDNVMEARLAKALDDFADAEFALGQAEVNGTSQECELRTRERDKAKAALLTELGHREDPLVPCLHCGRMVDQWSYVDSDEEGV